MSDNYTSLYYEDIKVGQDVTPLTMPITFTKLVMAASAGRDWQPYHHDREYTQKNTANKDVFIGVWFYMGMMSRLITDWAGPESFLRVLDFNMRKPIFPGDDMKLEGKVSWQRIEDNKPLIGVDITISSQAGPATTATVTVELPLRGKKA